MCIRDRVIAEGTVAQVQANPKVQEVYLGTAAGGEELEEIAAETEDAAAVESASIEKKG